jgi:hypothetical protein
MKGRGVASMGDGSVSLWGWWLENPGGPYSFYVYRRRILPTFRISVDLKCSVQWTVWLGP